MSRTPGSVVDRPTEAARAGTGRCRATAAGHAPAASAPPVPGARCRRSAGGRRLSLGERPWQAVPPACPAEGSRVLVRRPRALSSTRSSSVR